MTTRAACDNYACSMEKIDLFSKLEKLGYTLKQKCGFKYVDVPMHVGKERREDLVVFCEERVFPLEVSEYEAPLVLLKGWTPLAQWRDVWIVKDTEGKILVADGSGRFSLCG